MEVLLPFSCCFAPVYSTFRLVITREMTGPRVQCANEKTQHTDSQRCARPASVLRAETQYRLKSPPQLRKHTATVSFHAGRRRCPFGPTTVTAGSCRHCYRRSFLLGLPAASLLFSAGRLKQVLPAALTTDGSFLPLAATVSLPCPRHKGRRAEVRGRRDHNGLATHLTEPSPFAC